MTKPTAPKPQTEAQKKKAAEAEVKKQKAAEAKAAKEKEAAEAKAAPKAKGKRTTQRVKVPHNFEGEDVIVGHSIECTSDQELSMRQRGLIH